MRMLLSVKFPHEPFNQLVREGKTGEILGRILEDIKPEATYFTKMDGTRGAILVVELESPSSLPSLAKPFFLSFNADCQFRLVMGPEDLAQAGLDELGEKWG